MEIKLMANHFRGTQYNDCHGCSIARALKEIFPINHTIGVGISYLWVREKYNDSRHFSIEGSYTKDDFDIDKAMAEEFDYSPEVGIRKIKLVEYDNRAEMVNDMQIAGDSDGCLV